MQVFISRQGLPRHVVITPGAVCVKIMHVTMVIVRGCVICHTHLVRKDVELFLAEFREDVCGKATQELSIVRLREFNNQMANACVH
jgi:hypothetical protein